MLVTEAHSTQYFVDASFGHRFSKGLWLNPFPAKQLSWLSVDRQYNCECIELSSYLSPVVHILRVINQLISFINFTHLTHKQQCAVFHYNSDNQMPVQDTTQ